MFDFGFWELVIVFVVALVIVGPDKLPGLAAQVGRWVGKARRMVQSVRSDIEDEIKAAELREMLDKQQNEIHELKSILTESVRQTTDTVAGSNVNHGDNNELLQSVEDEIDKSGPAITSDTTKRD